MDERRQEEHGPDEGDELKLAVEPIKDLEPDDQDSDRVRGGIWWTKVEQTP